MKYFRFFVLLSVFIVASPEGFAAAKAYCPGDTAVLQYTVANVALSSGGSCGPITATGGYQSQTVAPNSEGTLSYTVLQNGGTFSLTCTNPGANPVTDTASLEISSSCSPPPPASSSCSYDSLEEGQLQWGAGNVCKAAVNYSVTVPNGGTATAENINSDYDGFLKYRCNNGAWEPDESKCAPTCGSAAVRTFSSPPTTNLCHAGDTASGAVLAAGLTPPAYLWRCTANGWIEFCRANLASPTPATCGADNEKTLNRTPTNLCAPGTASAVSPNIGGHAYAWTCSSGSSGDDVECWANSSAAASCGTTHYNCINSTVVASTETGGSTGPWTWRCIGTDNMPVDCEEDRSDTGGPGTTSDPPPPGSCPAPISYCGSGNRLYTRTFFRGSTGCSFSTSFVICPRCLNGECQESTQDDFFVPFTANTHGGRQPTFPGTGHLQVQPSLVRKGQPTWVYWNVKDALCTITGNNQTWISPTCGESHVGDSCINGTRANPEDSDDAWTWDCKGLGALSNTSTLTKCLEYKPRCDASHYGCIHGTSNSEGENSEAWTWNCSDVSRTASASCSEEKTCANGGITDERICNPTCENGGITDERICNPTCENGGITGPSCPLQTNINN